MSLWHHGIVIDRFVSTYRDNRTTRGRRHFMPLITFEYIVSVWTMIWKQASIDDDKYSTAIEQMSLVQLSATLNAFVNRLICRLSASHVMHHWSPIKHELEWSIGGKSLKQKRYAVLHHSAPWFSSSYLQREQKVLKESCCGGLIVWCQ